ncbi:ATP-binding protein [Streptomyces sp. NPDC046197]|uniref:ATP-binding protein n=1 Tax=Streptomyces sp. NPDC046197 TaxID=3154337 RepID=UPI0033D64884
MKQSAAKTLGVAALGAAFAAAGAGAANAAPAVPGAPQALGTVSKALPTEHLTKTLPGGQALNQAKPAVEQGLRSKPVAPTVLNQGPNRPVGGLLGGLPLPGLPLGGTSVNGIPLG